MKKFMNEPELFEADMLEGILLAHDNELQSLTADRRAIVRLTSPAVGKVGLATGGGSGHLPLFLGYVGKGLLDGVAVGDVFASPSASVMLDATRRINGGSGVLYLYGNYGGDVLNFDMAAEMARAEGIAVESVVGADDVASAPKGMEDKRRGIAGLFYLFKVAGAKADQGASLSEVKRVAEKAKQRTRSMGVAFSPCYLPFNGKESFNIGENEMEVGMGIHGEPGIIRLPVESSKRIVQRIMEAIEGDLPLKSGAEVSVLINGLGATSKEELYIVYRDVHRWLAERQISVAFPYVGEFATSMEMAGMSISIMELDEELKELVAAPCDTPFWRQDP